MIISFLKKVCAGRLFLKTIDEQT